MSRYLSLLLSSYQESELLSLGRLARMSGSRFLLLLQLLHLPLVLSLPLVQLQLLLRRMLVAEMPSARGTSVRFRAVVHCVVAVSRMRFLVRRWKKSRRSVRRQELGGSGEGAEQEVERQTTEERPVELDLTKRLL